MKSEWKGRPTREATGSTRRIVFSYRGFLGIDGLRTSIQLHQNGNRAKFIDAIAQRPQWMPFDWPESTPATHDALVQRALLKVLTVFEFGDALDGDTGDEIRSAVRKKHPEVSGTQSRPANGSRYAELAVEASIYDDGYFDGGYSRPETGALLPVSGRSQASLDEYVRNMVRADIRDRLGTGIKKRKSAP